MSRERTDPVTDDDGDDHHPAFGLISVHRISATPGEVLFQSDIRHPEYMRVDVHEAERRRNLKQDWVHPRKVVCSVAMSMSQFASFVASTNTQGVPCTIEFTGSGEHQPGERPGLNPAPRLALTHDEVRAAADEAYGRIKNAFAKYAEALEMSGAGSAAAKRAALGTLRSTIDNAAPNVAHAARRLDEHAEEVVEKSRADIEAMVTRTAERLGVPHSEIRAITENAE